MPKVDSRAEFIRHNRSTIQKEAVDTASQLSTHFLKVCSVRERAFDVLLFETSQMIQKVQVLLHKHFTDRKVPLVFSQEV